MMKTLVFGGTFNPPHIGHTAMCRAAAEAIGADRVIIMPTYLPPHKAAGMELESGEHRAAMCRRAFDGIAGVTVSDLELGRGGKSYTFDTLSSLKSLYPDDRLYFLCGADMFLSLHTWYRAEELPRLATFCAVPRDGEAECLRRYAAEHPFLSGRSLVLDVPQIDASSTAVRAELAACGASNMLADSVNEYIAEHGLYR